jgi:anti-sigma factor RsiW
MAANGCPGRELLLAYHTGELAEDSAEEVIAHLSRCAACQAVLRTFGESEDSLMARLRRGEAENCPSAWRCDVVRR